MPEQQFILAFVSIVMGGVVGLFFIGRVTGLIRHWIDSKKAKNLTAHQIDSLESLERFKVSAEKRLQNLETIAAEDRHFSGDLDSQYISMPDNPEHDNDEESGKLKNMLRQRM